MSYLIDQKNKHRISPKTAVINSNQKLIDKNDGKGDPAYKELVAEEDKASHCEYKRAVKKSKHKNL